MFMAMNHQRSLFLALVFFIQADLSAWCVSTCENSIGNYTSNSTYSAYLNTALSSLSTNVDINGFYNTSVGQDVDTVYASVLCRGDVQLNRCRECAKGAASVLLRECPNQKVAFHWDADEICTLRYSNDSMYGIMTISPGHHWWKTDNVTKPDEFKKDLETLIDNLRVHAADGGSLRKVAAGNVTRPGFQSVFALVQCTPDLTRDDCSSCLIGAASLIPICCDGSTGVSISKPSCFLRFALFPFYNETRLLEIETRSAPPVPKPLIEPPLPSSAGAGKDGGRKTRTVIIIVVSSVVVGLILAAAAIIFVRKRKQQKPMEDPAERAEAVDEINAAESLQHPFITIKAATNDFSDSNKLGQGGFGVVYKGKLPNGQDIAVKRLSRESRQGDLEFKNEVALLAKLQHRNLVRLLGFALEGLERLLIYEFVQNASLDLFIFDIVNHSCLNWDTRFKIIAGIARGIMYLHEDSRLRIVHRDLKASNVLLDKEMNPKIADFGMARLFGQNQTQAKTSQVVGTYGYISPEYLIHGQFSIKSDVFSFGVLVLEIISGRRNVPRAGKAEDLLSFAWNNWRAGASENVVDPFIMSGSQAAGSIRDIMRCIHIGLLCVQENAADRPTMASVFLMLSSSSITLAVPFQPAFYFTGGHGSDVSRLDEHFYSSGKDASVSDIYLRSSQNDSTITDLYPR